MTAGDLQAWILVATGAISLVSLTVGILLTLREYRLKVDAERRMQASAEVERDIRLLQAFSELMDIANGRSGYIFSDSTAEFILKHFDDELQSVDAEGARLTLHGDVLELLHQEIRAAAVMSYPVGSAQQDAAIAGIAVLCRRHPQLRTVGLQGLQSLTKPFTSPVAQLYLDELQVMVDQDAPA